MVLKNRRKGITMGGKKIEADNWGKTVGVGSRKKMGKRIRRWKCQKLTWRRCKKHEGERKGKKE